MAKKTFTGEKQNLLQLAEDVAAWLRQEGYEVQTGASPNAYLVQARKQSGVRRFLGSNQCIDVKIEGTPDSYSIEVDGGQWVKNLSDNRSQVVAAVASLCTLAKTIWSGSEPLQIEQRLLALKEDSCPKCHRIGASTPDGEKVLRTENIRMLPSGDYQGTRFFTDCFKCKFCAEGWVRGVKQRTVSLCPKCEQEGTREAAGETVFSCEETEEYSEAGQLLGKQSYTSNFRCRACAHSWDNGQQTRLVDVCPHCIKPSGIEFVERKVVRNLTRHKWDTETTMHDGPAGKTFSVRDIQVAVDFEVYVEKFRCKFCSKTWDTGEKTRQLG